MIHQNLALRALMYAECCFETFRCVQQHVFALDQHIHRLTCGLKSFGLTLPTQVIPESLQQAAKTADDCMVRITVGGNQAPWGLSQHAENSPAYWIQTMPMPHAYQDTHLQHVNWPFPLQQRQAKYTADYAITLRALNTLSLPPKVQPLICDQTQIYSGITSNVLLFTRGRWVTPPSHHILSGVIRQFLLQKGVVVAETCPLDILQDVQAIALTNSGSFITAVSTLDGRTLCTTGEMFDQLWQPLWSQRGVVKPC